MRRLLVGFLLATGMVLLSSAGWAAPASTAEARQVRAGLEIAADIGGHVTVFDSRGRVVVDLEKSTGQSIRVDVEPGLYDVRVESRGRTVRRTVEVGEGETARVDRASMAAQARPPRFVAPPAAPPIEHDGERSYAVNRIEARLGVWRHPSISVSDSSDDVTSASVDLAGGIEYLRFVSPDFGVGIAMTSQVRGSSVEVKHGADTSSGHATLSLPVMFRWNFARRLTDWRTIEPYVTGGVGPVFRVDWVSSDHRHDSDTVTESAVNIGGRLGLGFDVHIGSVWTLGVMGAWKWSDAPERVLGYGSRDRGGEIAFTMGWEFVRHPEWRR